MPATKQDLFALLDRLGISTETRAHEPVFTVEESQTLRGAIPGAHTKNLFLKDKKGALYLVVAREDTGVDLKRLHKVIASARLSFGPPELMRATLGVEPGSVTPLAAVNETSRRVTFILDKQLLEHDTLNFHPLSNDATTSIHRDDFLVFLRACGHEIRVADLAAAAAD